MYVCQHTVHEVANHTCTSSGLASLSTQCQHAADVLATKPAVSVVAAEDCVDNDTASMSTCTDTDADSTPGRTEADRRDEVEVGLSSSQRTSIRQLLDRHAELLMVR